MAHPFAEEVNWAMTKKGHQKFYKIEVKFCQLIKEIFSNKFQNF